MNASKEECQSAKIEVETVSMNIGDIVKSREDKADLQRRLHQVLLFLERAERKLPTKAELHTEVISRRG